MLAHDKLCKLSFIIYFSCFCVHKYEGVALILDETAGSKYGNCSMLRRRPITDGEITSQHIDIAIVQVYMPTTNHKEEEFLEINAVIEELIERKTAGTDYTVVRGDWNTVSGEGREDGTVGW